MSRTTMLMVVTTIYGLFVTSTIALGQDAPDCAARIQAAITSWGVFGQYVGSGLAVVAALRPFANLMLKGSLALSALPLPWAQVAGKAVWVAGTIVSLPCLGTPTVLKQVYAGQVTPPTKRADATQV